MNIKEKMLSKSNSYNYYKENYEKSKEENELLKDKINDLKLDKQPSLKEEFLKTYEDAISFCNNRYVDFYLSDNFENKLKEVTKHLDKKSKDKFKLYFLRTLFVNMIRQDSLYSKDEINDQNLFKNFEKNQTSENMVGEYRFFGEYNAHAFIDLKLNDVEKEFLKNKDIIDAGAFTGDTSIPLSKITNKNIYAFEPFNDSYNLLKMNIKANNIKNIVPINKSLGNINGNRTLYFSKNNVQGVCSDSNIRSFDEEIVVEETTIDTFVKENNLNVGYITIDVEGAEMDLLDGAIDTIKSQKPILCISIYHKVSDFFDIIPWIANLGLGYEFEIFKEQPWPFLADTVVKCTIK